MSKVAIYCRLSDEDKDKIDNNDSVSIQNQKNLLMKYAIEKDWDVYNIYSDDDYSGLDADRPQFKKMLVDAEARMFDIILCKTQSRFTRDMEILEKYLHNKFIEWNIRFVTAVDGVDTSDKHNKKSRQINGLVNEWYCEDVSESIKAVFRLKQQTGKFIGSYAPYGYMKDPNDKSKLIIDSEAAEVVRYIFNLYVEGCGVQNICTRLNSENILNPTMYKISKGLNFKNSSVKDNLGLWNKVTIKRIIKNQVYIGNMVQHKRVKSSYKSKKIKNLKESEWIVVENTHESIIENEIFLRAKNKLNAAVRNSGLGQAHPLAGKVRCKECKSNMGKSTTTDGYKYLRCKLKVLTSGRECNNKSINLRDLEERVWKEFKSLYILVEGDITQRNNIFNNLASNDKLKQLEAELNDIDNRLQATNIALKNLYLDKISTAITAAHFTEFNEIFMLEKDKIMTMKKQLEDKISTSRSNKKSLERYMSIINKYKDANAITHELVDELIDYVEVGIIDTLSGKRDINIYWNIIN